MHMSCNAYGHNTHTGFMYTRIHKTAYHNSNFQGWFDAARVELASNNIDITMVCPGPVFSNIRSNAFTESLDKVK